MRGERSSPSPVRAAPLAPLLLLAGAAAGQDAGPVVVNPRPDYEWLRLQDVRLTFEFEWRRDADEVDPAGGSAQRDVEDRFDESLRIEGGAFIGHPNLIDIDFDTRLGLRQRELDLDGNGQRTSETLLEYDVTARIFKEIDTPLTLYTRRSDNDIDRSFGGALENITSEDGGRIDFRGGAWPFSIEAFHRRQEQRDRTGPGDFDLDQNTVQLEGRHEPSTANRLWWDYTYDDVSESGALRPTRNFDRHEANVRHTLRFGADERHSAHSTFRYYDESGDLGFRQLRFSERVRLEHTDTLTTFHDLVLEDLRRTGLHQRSYDFRSTARHRLFESLVTTAQAGVRRLEVRTADFRRDEYFGQVDFDYTKRVYGGRFFGGASVSLSRADETPNGAPFQVIDQSFTFDAGGLVIIDVRNVDPGSIVITDPTGVILYDEGADYTVQAFFDRVEIRVVVGGDLAGGLPVLIDYVIGPEPGGITDTLATGLEARYTIDVGPLRGLSPYVRVRWQDEDRMFEGAAPFPENDFTDWIYGCDYDIWKISLNAEHQTRDSDTGAFEMLRFEGHYVERPFPGTSLVLSAYYNEIDRPDDDLRTAVTTLSARWNQRVSTRLRTSLLVQYRTVDDRGGNDSDAFEQEFELFWRYRQTEVYAEVRNTFIDSRDDDRNFQTYIVGLRRHF